MCFFLICLRSFEAFNASSRYYLVVNHMPKCFHTRTVVVSMLFVICYEKPMKTKASLPLHLPSCISLLWRPGFLLGTFIYRTLLCPTSSCEVLLVRFGRPFCLNDQHETFNGQPGEFIDLRSIRPCDFTKLALRSICQYLIFQCFD